MGITEQFLAFIIKNLSGKVTKTQLVKLMYLADLKSVEFTGEQITNVKWIRYTFGPYDMKLDKRLALLEKENYICVSAKSKTKNHDEIYFLYSYKGPSEIELDIDANRKQIINTILEQYGTFTLQALLDHVYNTPPMSGAEKGQELDLNKISKSDVSNKKK